MPSHLSLDWPSLDWTMSHLALILPTSTSPTSMGRPLIESPSIRMFHVKHPPTRRRRTYRWDVRVRRGLGSRPSCPYAWTVSGALVLFDPIPEKWIPEKPAPQEPVPSYAVPPIPMISGQTFRTWRRTIRPSIHSHSFHMFHVKHHASAAANPVPRAMRGTGRRALCRDVISSPCHCSLKRALMVSSIAGDRRAISNAASP